MYIYYSIFIIYKGKSYIIAKFLSSEDVITKTSNVTNDLMIVYSRNISTKHYGVRQL